METVQTFFRDYWAWDTSCYMLIGIGVLFLLIIGFFRRPGLGFAVALSGVYISLAIFMMSNYETYGIDVVWALATVLVGGLVVALGLYWGVFVKN